MATAMEGNFQFGLDIHFAQRLAGNVTKIREKTVKKLKRWIAARSLKQGDVGMESELLRLWKGLFYCMWMCDKPVIQEEMADNIAELVHSFITPKGAMAFFDAFLLTMKREWVGIDRLRMDKFFMFVRRCLRQVLVVLRNNDWEDSIVEQFLAVLSKTPLNPDPEASPDGLRYHFVDIYREELARCDGQELTPSVQVMKLIDPFCVLVTSTRNKTLLKVILRGFFQDIIDESDVGFQDESEDEGIDSGEEEKDEESKKDAEEKEESGESSEEEETEQMEKKKKYVRKERPKLKYDYEAIADRLFSLASLQSTQGFVRRKVYAIVKKFRDLKEGVFPDYNVGSLLDYQDDDDESERKYGERPPPEKQKKPRRRGGKQVKERRQAKAELEAARERQRATKRFADDEDLTDEESKEKEKGLKKKKRRRKKRKLKKIEVETEEPAKAETAEEQDVPLEIGNGIKEVEDGDASSREDKKEANDVVVDENKAVGESVLPDAKPGPGSDEVDGGTKRKRGKKRKSSVGQNELAEPVLTEPGLNGSEAQKENETADNEETKTASLDLQTADVKGTPSSAGSETNSSRKQRGKQGKRKSNLGGSENTEATNSGGPVDTADKNNTMHSKEEVQINLSQVSGLPKVSAATKDDTLQISTNTQELLEGGKQQREQPFATFQTVSTPPALVRRKVVRKEGEPKTEPPRKTKSRLMGLSEDADMDQPTPRKRVKIVLGLNKAHPSKDYKKQLESSPGIPFDGSKKPTQSVLKTPSPKPRPPTKKKTATPTFKTPSPKMIKEAGVKSSGKKRRSPKTAPNLRRSSRIKSTHK